MNILIADDQPDVLLALRFVLKAEGHSTASADSPAAILQSLQHETPDLIIMDLNYSRDTTSGEEGLRVLDRLKSDGCPAPVIVMTAWGSVELAVEAMRLGAVDFVMKPWDNQKLLTTVRRHLGAPAAKSKMNQEMDIARQVQRQLLPQRRPDLQTLEFDGYCLQAGAVGGDMYDFLEIRDGLVGLVLADIAGKGIPAALLMANFQATIRSLAGQAASNLTLMLSALNLQFLESTPAERYATLFFSEYDDHTRRLRYANCGHFPPLLIRANGDVERLNSNAPVVGLFNAFHVEPGEVLLAPGDRLAIYSDGIIEAEASGCEIGEEGLINVLRDNPAANAEQITMLIAQACGVEQRDDMTLLLARAR